MAQETSGQSESTVQALKPTVMESPTAAIEAGSVTLAGVSFDRLQGNLLFTPDLVEVRGLTLAIAGHRRVR